MSDAGRSKSKSMRLSFKGEKHKKKKKSSSSSSANHPDGGKGKRRADVESDVEDVGGDEQAWVPAESILDVNGPAFIYQNLVSASSSSEGEATPYAIQFNPTLQSITPTSVLPAILPEQASFLPDTEGLESGAAIAGVETTPTSVHQVWIANRVAGSEMWTFKSAEGKFLGATDRHGSVNALSEARGPLECWSLVYVPNKGGIAIKSAQQDGGGYLTLDEVAGGKVILRADGENAEECVWQVRLQWKFRHLARKEHGGEELTASGLKKTFDPSAALSADIVKLQRSRAGLIGGKMVEVDRRGLEKAQREGRLAEELLNRRSKLKSDRHAK